MKRGAVTMAVVLLVGAWVHAAPRIVIDPGHGGAQEGAVGEGGFFEKNLALQIATRLKGSLEQKLQASVLLTRERDVGVPLADRVALTNREKPDLFISIHANSMPTRQLRAHTEGVETFFLSASASDDEASKTADRENAESVHAGQPSGQDTLAFILADLQRSENHEDSSRLAYAVHPRVIAALHATDRGVQQAPFYVLTGVSAPAILLEVGFISQPAEGARLQSAEYQEKLAAAVTEGVRAFLERRR